MQRMIFNGQRILEDFVGKSEEEWIVHSKHEQVEIKHGFDNSRHERQQ